VELRALKEGLGPVWNENGTNGSAVRGPARALDTTVFPDSGAAKALSGLVRT
jgi:hypothetical protein